MSSSLVKRSLLIVLDVLFALHGEYAISYQSAVQLIALGDKNLAQPLM